MAYTEITRKMIEGVLDDLIDDGMFENISESADKFKINNPKEYNKLFNWWVDQEQIIMKPGKNGIRYFEPTED